ncbi:MAG TPA: hypothetical protein PKO33_14575 [Pyrinomonadaceae bacterium]|nr:hypothetical protein [Pyrinomonadaceae bacterium]
MNNNKMIVRLSIVAGLAILAMFAVTVFTGVSQEKFENVLDAGVYARELIAEQGPLRLIFTIDFVFIAVFTTVFVILPQSLKTGSPVVNGIANLSIGAMVLCGLLDFVEDLHILTMLDSANKGLALADSQIALQAFLSALKFCASYVSLFALAFILPSRTIPEKLIRYSLWFFQLPVGALVYTAPHDYRLLFGLMRFAFMITGFFLLAYNFSRAEAEESF